MSNIRQIQPHKGRGAVSNIAGRFESFVSEFCDDGWDFLEHEHFKSKTTLHTDMARNVLTPNTSPDVPFDQSINPYRGCEHGCVYCFARPTHAYLGHSAGLDFETEIYHKPQAAELLQGELSKPGYTPKVIALGTNTDPYQPVERDLKITRQILKTLAECKHPFSIVTKSSLVMRDIDIIAPMAKAGLATVAISVTTLDHKLSNKLEPRASAPHKRLKTIRALAQAGIDTTVLIAPIIPALNDWELERIMAACFRAGAINANYILLRQPGEVKNLMDEWLEIHAPDKKSRVQSLIRQSRGGKYNQSAWGTRMTGTGPYAEMLRQRFHLTRNRLGLKPRTMDLDCTQFVRPIKPSPQMDLF